MYIPPVISLPYRPEQRFEEHIPAEDHDTLEPKKQILKRSKELVAAAASTASQKVLPLSIYSVWRM